MARKNKNRGGGPPPHVAEMMKQAVKNPEVQAKISEYFMELEEGWNAAHALNKENDKNSANVQPQGHGQGHEGSRKVVRTSYQVSGTIGGMALDLDLDSSGNVVAVAKKAEKLAKMASKKIMEGHGQGQGQGKVHKGGKKGGCSHCCCGSEMVGVTVKAKKATPPQVKPKPISPLPIGGVGLHR